MVFIEKIRMKQLLFGLKALFISLRSDSKNQNNLILLQLFIENISTNGFNKLYNIKNGISKIEGIDFSNYIKSEMSKLCINFKGIDIKILKGSIPLILSILKEFENYYNSEEYEKIYYLADSIHNLPRLLLNIEYFNDEMLGNVNIMNYLKDNNESIIKKEWQDFGLYIKTASNNI